MAVQNNGNVNPNAVRIKYYNNTKHQVLTSVTFRVHLHGAWSVLHDKGHFGSHAMIDHTFNGLTSKHWEQDNPTACIVYSWAFAGGGGP